MYYILYIPRMIQALLQKLFWGYNYKDMWNLDHHFAIEINKRLKYFRKHRSGGHPIDTKNNTEWNYVIDKMILGFDNIINEWKVDFDIADDKQFYNEINEGLDLFRKHFRDLWD